MPEESRSSYFPGAVAKVIDEYTIVINRGSEHGISKGDHFLIYSVDPIELTDPETGKSLGCLEIVKGTGSAVHVQAKMTTVKSNRSVSKGRVVRRISTPNPLRGLLAFQGAETEEIEEPEREALPFDNVELGDKVKPV